MSSDASAFEKRNYKKYGTVSHCVKQIEYDMKHGVEKTEVIEILRKIRLGDKYADLRKDAEAIARLASLEDLLSGAQKIEGMSWHSNAFKEKSENHL